MTYRSILTSLVLAAASLAATAPAQAQRQPFENPFQRGNGVPSNQWDVPSREQVPGPEKKQLREILPGLERRYGGEHLKTREQGQYYIISWRTRDGRIISIRVNAITGREE